MISLKRKFFKKGILLIYVLMLTAFIVILLTAAVFQLQNTVFLINKAELESKARWAALSGLEYAEAKLNQNSLNWPIKDGVFNYGGFKITETVYSDYTLVHGVLDGGEDEFYIVFVHNLSNPNDFCPSNPVQVSGKLVSIHSHNSKISNPIASLKDAPALPSGIITTCKSPEHKLKCFANANIYIGVEGRSRNCRVFAERLYKGSNERETYSAAIFADTVSANIAGKIAISKNGGRKPAVVALRGISISGDNGKEPDRFGNGPILLQNGAIFTDGTCTANGLLIQTGYLQNMMRYGFRVERADNVKYPEKLLKPEDQPDSVKPADLPQMPPGNYAFMDGSVKDFCYFGNVNPEGISMESYNLGKAYGQNKKLKQQLENELKNLETQIREQEEKSGSSGDSEQAEKSGSSDNPEEKSGSSGDSEQAEKSGSSDNPEEKSGSSGDSEQAEKSGSSDNPELKQLKEQKDEISAKLDDVKAGLKAIESSSDFIGEFEEIYSIGSSGSGYIPGSGFVSGYMPGPGAGAEYKLKPAGYIPGSGSKPVGSGTGYGSGTGTGTGSGYGSGSGSGSKPGSLSKPGTGSSSSSSSGSVYVFYPKDATDEANSYALEAAANLRSGLLKIEENIITSGSISVNGDFIVSSNSLIGGQFVKNDSPSKTFILESSGTTQVAIFATGDLYIDGFVQGKGSLNGNSVGITMGGDIYSAIDNELGVYALNDVIIKSVPAKLNEPDTSILSQIRKIMTSTANIEKTMQNATAFKNFLKNTTINISGLPISLEAYFKTIGLNDDYGFNSPGVYLKNLTSVDKNGNFLPFVPVTNFKGVIYSEGNIIVVNDFKKPNILGDVCIEGALICRGQLNISGVRNFSLRYNPSLMPKELLFSTEESFQLSEILFNQF